MKALLALTTGLLVAGALPGWADDPTRSAWYSAATVGGVAAPAPTVAQGDLRVSGTGERPTAYAALALTSPGTSGGELVLAVRRGSLGTVELAACPTEETDWEAGGNQPFGAGPGYDCAAGAVFGSLSADGTSVSFSLDSSVQPVAGTLSIAIAPLPEASAPFTVDLGDPVYTPAGAAQESAAEPPAAPEPAAAPAAGGAGTGTEGGTGTGGAEAPPLQPAAEVPLPADVPDGGLAAEPALAEVLAPPAAAGDAVPAPETAPEVAEGTPVLPGAQLAAGASEVPAGPRLLALLTLVGVSAGAGYAAGQQRTQPRLLGGRARALPAGGPAEGAAPGAALAVREPAPAALPRGIGRFSRVRETAPRRLR